MRPTPPSGLSSAKRPVPTHSSQPASSSHDHIEPKRHGFQNSSKAHENYFRAVGIKIDEATEPGVSDEDAAHYHALIKKLLRSTTSGSVSEGIPPRPEGVKAGAAISQGLRKRLKSSDDAAVLNTLVFIDELMRTIPHFYAHISNDKFFRQLWRLVDPDYKDQPFQIRFITSHSKVMRNHRIPSEEIRNRVLILIRAWAETLGEMRLGLYDPTANFFIERYKNKRQRIAFPELPKTDSPWVCPIPRLSNPNRHLSRVRGSSSASNGIDFAVTIDEIENSVSLFSSLVDNASSASDLKSELCLELAEKCEHIARGMEKFGANLTTDKEIVRVIAINDALKSTLTRYKNGLNRKDWGQDDMGHIATVSLDSEEDEMYDDAFEKSNDDPLPNFKSMRVRSIENHEASSSSMGQAMPSDVQIPRRSHTYADARHGSRYPNNPRYGDPENDFSDKHDPGPSNHSYDEVRKHDRDGEDYREVGHASIRGLDDHDKSQDSRILMQKRRDDSKSSSDTDTVETNSRFVTERDVTHRRSREKSRAREVTKSSKSKEIKIDKKVKSPVVQSNESAAPGRHTDRTLKASKKKQVESSTGDDDSHAKEDDSISSSDGWSDPANEESFKLLAERFKAQKQMRSTKKTNSKSSTKKSSDSRRNVSPGSVDDTRQGGSSSGVRGFAQAPMMFGGNSMFAPGMGGMGINPMMMMGAPMANPFGMYGSVNPMFMSDPMGMFNPYSTVNPAMYYQSINPNLLPGMASSMGGIGFGDMGMGIGNRNSGPGSQENMGHRFDGSTDLSNSLTGIGANHDKQTGQMTIVYPNNDSSGSNNDQGSHSALPGSSSDAGRLGGTSSFVNPGWSVEMSPPRLNAAALPGPVVFNNNGTGVGGPRNSGDMLNSSEGLSTSTLTGGGSGLSRQQVERQAAMYHSAMQQAATAYHMAATAYQTMQGQAALTANEQAPVRSDNTQTTSDEAEHQSPSSTKEA